MFAQMNARKIIEKFGERALAALIKEFKQLNVVTIQGNLAICPIDPKNINAEWEEKLLNIVTLIKDKINGDIKDAIPYIACRPEIIFRCFGPFPPIRASTFIHMPVIPNPNPVIKLPSHNRLTLLK